MPLCPPSPRPGRGRNPPVAPQLGTEPAAPADGLVIKRMACSAPPRHSPRVSAANDPARAAALWTTCDPPALTALERIWNMRDGTGSNGHREIGPLTERQVRGRSLALSAWRRLQQRRQHRPCRYIQGGVSACRPLPVPAS